MEDELYAHIAAKKPDARARLALVRTLLFRAAEDAKVEAAKITNGTLGESIACEHFGFEWNDRDSHNHDAIDRDGRTIELKTIARTSKRYNINYRMPARRKDEGASEYVNRARKKFEEEAAGGHFWCVYSGRANRVDLEWRVDGARFAAFVAYRFQRTGKAAFNLGCEPCRRCKGAHRIDFLADAINRGDFDAAVTTVVKRDCHNT